MVNTKLGKILGMSAIIAILILLSVYPFLMLFYGSFGGTELDPIYYLRAVSDYWNLAALTILVSVGACGLALFFGITLAWISVRTDTPFVERLETLTIAPFFVSSLIFAMSWTRYLGWGGLVTGIWDDFFGTHFWNLNSYEGIIWVMGLSFVPYVYLYVSAALKSMNPSYEEASRMCGRGILHTVRKITLPLISPSILSATLIIFMMSISFFSVPLTLGRPYGIFVLTTKIWSLLKDYPADYSQAAALSVLLVIFSFIGVALQRKLLGRRYFTTITGTGYRKRKMSIGKWKYLTLAFYLFYMVALTIVPIALFITCSFLPLGLLQSFPKFTLGNYYNIFSSSVILRSIQNSLVLAAIGATVTTFFTFVVALICFRTRIKGRGILEYLSMMPVAIPSTALAAGLLWAWIRFPIVYGSIWVLLIAYITNYQPHGIRSAASSLSQIDKTLEEASYTSGAGWGHTITRIILPLVKPSLVAGWILLFVSMIRELSASAILYRYGTEVMSVMIYENYQSGSFGDAAALGTIQLLLLFVSITLFTKLLGTNIKKIT